jgi:diaminopimelate decarboxylase
VGAAIRSINVESLDELEAVATEARAQGRVTHVAVRLNPDVAAATHRYLTTGTAASKFGLERGDAAAAARRAAADEWLELAGISFHVGSQLLDTAPVLAAAGRAAELWRGLEDEGLELRDLNGGGGLGIAYENGAEADVTAYLSAITAVARSLGATLLLEPGRYLVGPVGTFVTRVLYVKHAGDRVVAVCDGGINDLIRPLLYGAEHPIRLVADGERETAPVDVVGPLCESGDFLALERTLPLPRPGDLLAVEVAGAYGRVMSSTYNARPLCAEVLLEGGEWRLGREPGRVDDLVRGEHF